MNGEPELARCISETFLDAAAMDVDLRQFVPIPKPLINDVTSECKGDMDEREGQRQDLKTKKQHSSPLGDSHGEESDDCEGPFPKKSKSEQMDM